MKISNLASMEPVENQIAQSALTQHHAKLAVECLSFMKATVFVELKIVRFVVKKVAQNAMKAFL